MTLHSNRFSSLILGGLMLTALPFQGNANTLHNSSFEHGNTLADALLWHRMTGSPASVTEIESGWNIDDQTAWHGSRSLRGNGQTPLVFCAEVWKSLPSKKSPWVFSVYLKADRPGVKCELATGLYTRFSENQMTNVVELDTEW